MHPARRLRDAEGSPSDTLAQEDAAEMGVIFRGPGLGVHVVEHHKVAAACQEPAQRRQQIASGLRHPQVCVQAGSGENSIQIRLGSYGEPENTIGERAAHLGRKGQFVRKRGFSDSRISGEGRASAGVLRAERVHGLTELHLPANEGVRRHDRNVRKDRRERSDMLERKRTVPVAQPKCNALANVLRDRFFA